MLTVRWAVPSSAGGASSYAPFAGAVGGPVRPSRGSRADRRPAAPPADEPRDDDEPSGECGASDRVVRWLTSAAAGWAGPFFNCALDGGASAAVAVLGPSPRWRPSTYASPITTNTANPLIRAAVYRIRSVIS